jgi:hypothetical protein
MLENFAENCRNPCFKAHTLNLILLPLNAPMVIELVVGINTLRYYIFPPF